MLVGISTAKAFEMLMDDERREKVYYKVPERPQYILAYDKAWHFNGIKHTSGVRSFGGVKFFEEVEDKENEEGK